jgi:hypothetical protein
MFVCLRLLSLLLDSKHILQILPPILHMKAFQGRLSLQQRALSITVVALGAVASGVTSTLTLREILIRAGVLAARAAS